MPFPIAKLEEIPDGGCVVVRPPGHLDLALFRRGERVFLVDNACPHMGGPIAEGEIRGGVVTCPWHDWDFDIETGKCLNVSGEALETYKVFVKDGEVFLDD